MQEFIAQYQVSRGGKTLGTYDLAAIRQMVVAGMLAPTDFIWTKGMTAWQPISAVLPDVGATPASPPLPVGQGAERERLRAIAVNQRALNWLFLGALLLPCLFVPLAGLMQVMKAGAGEVLAGLLAFVMCLLLLVGFVFLCVKVYRLARALKTSLPPVLFVIGVFVPCISYIILLSLSLMASSALRQAGLQVGLMGADPDSIR